MVQQPPAPRRRGLLRLVRGWLQRRPNTLPTEAVALAEMHEPMNPVRFGPPTSDQGTAPKEALQRIGYFVAQVYLVSEFAPAAIDHPNPMQRELAAYSTRLVHPGDLPEPRNLPESLTDFFAAHPELDNKDGMDWYALRPNKDVMASTSLDPETVQRIKFTRFLLQRGTYNEGFEAGEEAPQYYRTIDDFSRDDLRSTDKEG
jgi:hypothetical protein